MESREGVRVKVSGFEDKEYVGRGVARVDPVIYAAIGAGSIANTALIHGSGDAVVTLARSGPEDEGSNIIRIDGPTRRTVGTPVGGSAVISLVKAPPAIKMSLAPLEDSAAAVPVDTLRRNLTKRPLLEGMEFLVSNVSLMGNPVFKVVSTFPRGPVTVDDATEITYVKPPAEKKPSEAGIVTYADIGGLDKELKRIRELVEWPLARPDVYRRLGMDTPKGVLLHGPPGTGKTLIAQAIANESGAYFISVRGPELFSAYVGSSEGNLRKIFEEAEKNAPSIIFFDEIDAIARKREDLSSHVTAQNMMTMLLTLMDGIGSDRDVIVLGATNTVDDLDPAIRRPGRFDREIEIGIPTYEGRRDILRIRTVNRGMPLDDDVDLDEIAKMTQGFTGADIASLATEAANRTLMRVTKGDRDALDSLAEPEALAGLKVTMRDFTDALADVKPSGMREISGGIPKVTWNDIGGLDDIRREISEMLPGETRDRMSRLGVRPGKGVLLYGPPGTGKTLVAKAVANEKGLNFIPVNGPELLTHWVGDSERGLRKVFERAKSMAPSVIFFDEIDSIAPKRGAAASGVYESMVAQLLTCLDGVTELKDVLVLAATNRPDIIDPAVLRPGRIDRMILIGAPSAKGRKSILEVCTRDMPLSDDVNLALVSDKTEGFVGADLEKLCREAGMSAYRRGSDTVDADDFEKALRKVVPSADEGTMNRYVDMGGQASKSRDRWENESFYH